MGFWNREILAKMLADKVYICVDDYGRLTICDNSVDSAKIKDGGVQTADIADGAITAEKLDPSVEAYKTVPGSTLWNNITENTYDSVSHFDDAYATDGSTGNPWLTLWCDETLSENVLTFDLQDSKRVLIRWVYISLRQGDCDVYLEISSDGSSWTSIASGPPIDLKDVIYTFRYIRIRATNIASGTGLDVKEFHLMQHV